MRPAVRVSAHRRRDGDLGEMAPSASTPASCRAVHVGTGMWSPAVRISTGPAKTRTSPISTLEPDGDAVAVWTALDDRHRREIIDSAPLPRSRDRHLERGDAALGRQCLHRIRARRARFGGRRGGGVELPMTQSRRPATSTAGFELEPCRIPVASRRRARRAAADDRRRRQCLRRLAGLGRGAGRPLLGHGWRLEQRAAALVTGAAGATSPRIDDRPGRQRRRRLAHVGRCPTTCCSRHASSAPPPPGERKMSRDSRRHAFGL